MDFLFPIPPLGGPFQCTPCPHRRDPIGRSYAPRGPRFLPKQLERKATTDVHVGKQNRLENAISFKNLGGERGSGTPAKKKNKARGGRLQVQPRLRCMAGAPLAGSVRSKWSGAKAPGRQNPPRWTSLTGFQSPTSRYRVLRNGPDACSLRSSQQYQRALVLVPFVAGRGGHRTVNPPRERGIEHRFDAVTGGRPRLLNVKSTSIADQWQHLRVCHDDATQSKGPSDRRCPIVVDAIDAGCHFLPTILCIFDVRNS